MTTNEIIRIFDIHAHCLIFLALIYIALHTDCKAYWARMQTCVSAFLSLFLSITAWQYGRTPTFLVTHTIWEYVMVLNLLFLFHKYEDKR
jgi:hypothetical protein